MAINDNISSLIAGIKSTAEFRKLKQSIDTISGNPPLKKGMEDFSSEQKKVYTSNLSEQEVKTRLTQVDSKYEKILKSSEATTYFKALSDFNKSMSDIIQSINEGIEKALK